MSVSRMPSYAPPPYTGGPPNERSYGAMEQHQSSSPTQSSTAPRPRPMPPMPLRVVNLSPLSEIRPGPDEDPTRSGAHAPHSEISLQPQRSTSPHSSSPPSLTSPSATSPSSSQSPTHAYSTPLPYPTSPSKGQAFKRRLKINPLSALRLSGATRRATAQIAEHAARQAAEHARYEAELAKQREAAAEAARRAAEEAARIEEERAMRLAVAQEEAKAHVQSYLQSFLSSDPPTDEELSTAFLTCAEACKVVGLEFAAVLQEPLIEEHPPIYWAILNRPTAYGTDRAAYDSFVFALLGASQPLSLSTYAAVRLACTTASDNTLLQRLFRHVPELSPLSPSDAMLLAPLNETDLVEVMETRDGTGTFIAHIRILRFRLRMRVSKCVVVEFVASERIWALRFAVVVETSMDGRTETKWLLSLELGEQSQVVAVDADLFIEGSALQPLDSRDFEDPLLCISFGSTTSELWPGRDNGITVRLDDGPMGPHLLNESSVLVDSNGTLCAQLNARLARPVLPALVEDTSSTISPPRSLETPFSEISYPSSSNSIKSKKAKKRPRDPKVYTSLRRGGR
ncbi:hypothetical protein EDB92DRAFT_1943865 [Lactarius akahatsu]|uniref:Uncharacterized protein n=1 Tax=Lactarius akahatsu TaxID=416441 RepID=A0AAD4LJT4_9AGAM|nr:hypothetical protein EDB92DRAFT_1943865 [Lactarius akahatsu]